MANPFHLSGYTTAEYFCNRELEKGRLISSIQNNRNTTLFAQRRIGKTGLILHLFNHLEEDKNTKCFYVDIMPTLKLADFVNAFGKEILGKLDKNPIRIIKKAKKIFSFLRPQLSLDPTTGEPSVQLNIEKEQDARYTLDEIFSYLHTHSQEHKIVIAIDEFQQINQYPEDNIEGLLRSKIQLLNNVSFIFSGSQKHILINMFADNSRPFYQSTEMMELTKIEKKHYLNFILYHFDKNNCKISIETATLILDFTFNHTYFVQFLCNRLYGSRIKIIDKETVKTQVNAILQENATIYYGYQSLLTLPQWKLLTAIARASGASEIQSKKFVQKNDLGSSSNVNRSLNSLIEKDMIYQENNLYYLNDAFLSRWLEWYH